MALRVIVLLFTLLRNHPLPIFFTAFAIVVIGYPMRKVIVAQSIEILEIFRLIF